MSRRAWTCLLCTLTLCIAAAPARAHWDVQNVASPGWQAPSPFSSALTSEGDAIAVWAEQAGDVWRQMVGVFPRSGSPVSEQLAANVRGAAVAADGAGNAVAVYSTSDDGDVHWRERAPGGTFGATHALGLTGFTQVLAPTAAMNARGDLALVWTRSASVWAAVRPAGESSFGAPVELGGSGESWGWPRARLSDSGELLVIWEAAGSGEVRSVHRSPGGETSAVQVVSTAGTSARLSAFAMDSHGRALLAWQPARSGGSYGTPRLSSRTPGGDFEPTTFPGPGPTDYRHAVGITGDGVVTIAYATGFGMRVYSGAFGGPFRRLGTYSRDGGGLGGIVIATSPGGRTLVAWAGAYPHWLSAQRSSDGNLGPIEDVAPGCESMSTPDLSVDDGGHTLAFWGGYYESPETRLARGDDGPGHQGCAPESHYQSASMNPAPRGGPGGGSWELPLLPNAPEHVLAGLDVQTPTIAGEGATRRVSVRAKCGEECYGFGSLGIVGPKGRLLYRVRLGGAGSGAGNRLSFEQGFTMKPALRRKLAGRPLKAVLRLKFGDAWNRRVSRHFKVQGADVTD